MDTKSLLDRLDAIGQSLEQSANTLALIGLGSVGLEISRMDEYSDLDFFVIVEAGYKPVYLNSLEWLSNIHPIAYSFRNTVDGYKLLFEDGIFCEFAIFEFDELQKIPFAPGRVVWKRAGIPDTISQPFLKPASPIARDKEFLLGEAITNLYVGLNRDKRGEKLSAMRFIQQYAVDRLLELAEYIEPEHEISRDPFVNERRIERRHPSLDSEIRSWAQGYDRNRESALAILDFIERHFHINETMAKAIRQMSM